MSQLILDKVQIGQTGLPATNFVWEKSADGIMVLRRGTIDSAGAELMRFKADGTAVIPGAVGTVSQAAGVPTGAIMESGSNTNGQYVKYADGTLICTTKYTAGLGMSAYITNLSVGTFSWTFPASFAGTTVAISGSGLDQSNVGWLGCNDPTATAASVLYYSKTSVVTATSISVMAIGRWF